MPPETPSAWKLEPFTQPALLPICCLCGLIRDDRGSSPGLARWLTPRTYRHIYGLRLADCSFTHTYCPTCCSKVRDTMLAYVQQI